MFVHGVIEDFKHTVMQAPFIRVADIHSGPLPDRF
jgi:hypothetical protein